MTDKKEKQAVFTLHRYFIWCEQMKNHFEQIAMSAGKINDLVSPEGAKLFMYMSYWYASLYVVADGWKILKLADARVDALRSSKHLHLLREYRNGVFHFQRKYLDDRFLDFMKMSKETVVWTRDLHEAFGTFFLQWFAAHRAQSKPRA
jgi:hypothetical protein